MQYLELDLLLFKILVWYVDSSYSFLILVYRIRRHEQMMIGIIHTVTDMNGKSDSDLIQPGTGCSYTFYNEDKCTYYCIIPPWMNGLVIVTCFQYIVILIFKKFWLPMMRILFWFYYFYLAFINLLILSCCFYLIFNLSCQTKSCKYFAKLFRNFFYPC